MGKKIFGTFSAILFLALFAGVGLAKMNCTVETVKGDTLVLKGCDDHKQLDKMKAGAAVSVATKKKKAESH